MIFKKNSSMKYDVNPKIDIDGQTYAFNDLLAIFKPCIRIALDGSFAQTEINTFCHNAFMSAAKVKHNTFQLFTHSVFMYLQSECRYINKNIEISAELKVLTRLFYFFKDSEYILHAITLEEIPPKQFVRTVSELDKLYKGLTGQMASNILTTIIGKILRANNSTVKEHLKAFPNSQFLKPFVDKFALPKTVVQ